MSENEKKVTGQDFICKRHNARTEKDIFRVSPTKLSKHELEDLYYSLLESNMDLKKTINNQKEKIRELSTKVQRMTAAQRISLNKELKECCTVTKAVCNEQKEKIADLKQINERLSERIKLLNMKLCSTKQFLQRNPFHSTSKCSKYSLTNITSLKNTSTSAFNTKKSENNIKATADFSQYLMKNKDGESPKDAEMDANDAKEISSTRSMEIKTIEIKEQDKNESSKTCDENKCKTEMEEFKQKIVNLQEELSKTHDEYLMRITKLDSEVLNLRNENLRVRSERAASEHSLQQNEKTMTNMADRLRQAEAQYTELAMQLSLERRKVTELEMLVKSSQMSSNLVKTIEERLNANEVKLALLKQNTISKSPRLHLGWDASSPRLAVPVTPGRDDNPGTDLDKDCTKISKYSDDSGFLEGLCKSQEVNEDKTQKMNGELMERIGNLQVELDKVKKNLVSDDDLVDLREPNTDPIKKTKIRYSRAATVPNDVRDTYGEEASCSKVRDDIPTPKTLLELKTKYSLSNRTSQTKSEDVPYTHNKSINNLHDDLQIPRSLAIDTNDKFRRKSRKQLSNVDKFIKKYYQRKNVEDNDFGVQNTSKDAKNSYYDCEIMSDIRTDEANLVNTNDNKTIKRTDNNKTESLNEISNIDGLEMANYIIDIKNTQDFPITINKVDICSEDKTIGVNNNNENRNAIKDQCIKVGSNESTEKVKKDDTHILECKTPEDLFLKQGNNCNIEKSKEPKLENKNELKLKENVLHKEIYSKDEGTIKPAVLDEKERKTVDCGVQYETSEIKDLGTQIDKHSRKEVMHKNINESSQASPRTYTVQGNAEVTDHDTDCEISSMTDLPSENDRTPRERLSPGENKPVPTYSDSCTSPYETTDYKSLSEGELPGFGKAKSDKLSQGEKPMPYNERTQHNSNSMNMEEALQAITEELAKCKQLLRSQRPQEVNYLARFS